MGWRQYSCLCRLIHDSLHPFTVKSTVSMTKQQEKSLLIKLSQVSNKIKHWTAEFDSDSRSSSDSDNDDHGNPLIDTSNCHSSASHCLLKITNDLVFLLAVDSRYARHLAANVLVSVSEFVIASGSSYWEEFLQWLSSFFELMICELTSPSTDPPIKFADNAFDLRPVLNNARWQSVGAIVLVLRTILKQQDDAEILETYFRVLGSCLQVIPWDSCNRILAAEINPVSWFEFCGYFVQLLCSLADCEDENPAVHQIFNIFPKILTWDFGNEEEIREYACIYQYIRHKILVLMIRLSSITSLDCKTVISWLNLIETYFQDLLSESVSEPEADEDDCLRDSPFNGTSHRHLQRRVVFVYTKCAFSLIKVKENCGMQCSCGDMNSCSKKGVTALYEWLKRHLPANVLDNHELYDDYCKSFTKSFIQLYIHEDDMLFKILLQLTYSPFEYTQRISEDCISQVVEKDIRFLLSDIFDPVRLFHLFLSELHYDHQVLLDYLISKDIGATCAEYLLRCLRIICDKQDSSLEVTFRGEVERGSFPKRRKLEDKRAFYKARDCLLLLKKSVESLHQKDLFPYNPQVLLRRITRFQELGSR